MTQKFTLPKHNRINQKTAYINARIIDAKSGFDEMGQLLVEGDKIADFGTNIFPNGTSSDVEMVDCGGNVLCAGLIDIHVHCREPGQEYKETIATGTKSAAAGGITTISCIPNTSPVIDDVSVVDFIHKRAKETGFVNVTTYASITKGMKGKELTEMALLKEVGVVGFTDDGLPVMNANIMRNALAYAGELDLVVAQHAEDLYLSNGGCMNEGAVSAKLGVKGSPNAAEAVMVARDIMLTKLTGGRYHLLHISTSEAVEEIRRAKAQGLRVTAEAAPHHFTLTEEAVLEYRTFSKMCPPLRAEKDRLAVLEGLKDGTIDAIATDHAPHDSESKRQPLEDAAFGVVGLETMLPLSLKLYYDGEMELIDVIAAMTYKPASIINVDSGEIKIGARADLVLIDIEKEWVINPEEFVSKSKNSPFLNMKVKGKALRTIVGGEEVYNELG